MAKCWCLFAMDKLNVSAYSGPLQVLTTFLLQGKGKAVPLQAWTGPEGSRKLRLPDFVTTAQDGGKFVSLTHRPLFTPRKYSWYSFLLEAESTPGPYSDRKDFVSMKNKFKLAGIEPATSSDL